MVATTPPTISRIVRLVGAPVKSRDMSFANEWNDWPPKYSRTTPQAISANESALTMENLFKELDAAV